MNISRKMVLAASALAITGSVAAGGAVSATTLHCDTTDYPNKVNLDGAGATYDTDLPEGTEVCIKAGNSITIVIAGPGGVIENVEILNTNGKAKGISYFAYGDVCEDPYGCDPQS